MIQLHSSPRMRGHEGAVWDNHSKTGWAGGGGDEGEKGSPYE